MKTLLISIASASLILPIQSFGASILAFSDFTGGTYYSGDISAVSANGTKIAGSHNTNVGYEAHIYQNSQITSLGHFPSVQIFSGAAGISADGSTVVGRSTNSTSTVSHEAFIYQNGQMIGLGYLPGGSFRSTAYDVSADGSVVVGDSSAASTIYNVAFTYQNGQMTALGDLPGGLFASEANAVSNDGSIVVGSSSSASGSEAFIYQNEQMIGLGDLSGGSFFSSADGISADGSTVVGASQSALGVEAFIYQNGQMTGLGGLSSEFFESFATGVSADGSIVVGRHGLGGPFRPAEALLWKDDGNGNYLLSSLQDELFLLGVNITLDGWTELSNARDISDDGNTIIGYGIRNGQKESFIVNLSTVPIPAAAWLFGSALLGLAGLQKFNK